MDGKRKKKKKRGGGRAYARAHSALSKARRNITAGDFRRIKTFASAPYVAGGRNSCAGLGKIATKILGLLDFFVFVFVLFFFFFSANFANARERMVVMQCTL